MSDKEVERNVRSTTVDGVQTPTQRHVQGIGEQHAITFGEKTEAKKTRESLLEKFRRREVKRRSVAEGTGEKREGSEPGDREGRGEDTT